MTGIKNIIFDISGVFLTLDETPTLEYYAKKLKVPFEKINKVHESLICKVWLDARGHNRFGARRPRVQLVNS